MLACFATDGKDAIPLEIIAKSNFASWQNTCSESTKTWLKTSGFAADPKDICLIPNAQGQLSQVVFICEDPKDFWQTAGLAKRLPAFTFELKNSDEQQLSSLALGWALGAYQYTRYKTPKFTPARLVLTETMGETTSVIANAIYMARDLINTPAEDLGPQELAAAAKELAARFQAQINIIEGEALLAENFSMIYHVGKSSPRLPCLVDIHWNTSQPKRLTLIGKGICFDTGGLDIKPSQNMLLMRKDMGGAACALALAQLIMEFNLPIALRVLIPCADNAIGGNAFRPGDIMTARNGTRVEISNTDAEGRLLIAEALCAAHEELTDLVIDFTTLTGAARVAVGTEIAAFLTPDDTLAERLMQCSKLTRDPIWRLPLFSPYGDFLESKFADVCNASSSSYAGAITAGLFLQRFAGTLPWAHFDMMAWNVKERPGRPEGGDILAIRCIFEFLQRYF